MISTGNGADRSATASNVSRSASGSRNPLITSRTIGSRAVTARGVNTRLTSARNRSCSGGSIMMIIPRLRMSSASLVNVDRSTPWALEKPRQSRWAATTSAKRERA